jgi:hypothetical protein
VDRLFCRAGSGDHSAAIQKRNQLADFLLISTRGGAAGI